MSCLELVDAKHKLAPTTHLPKNVTPMNNYSNNMITSFAPNSIETIGRSFGRSVGRRAVGLSDGWFGRLGGWAVGWLGCRVGGSGGRAVGLSGGWFGRSSGLAVWRDRAVGRSGGRAVGRSGGWAVGRVVRAVGRSAVRAVRRFGRSGGQAVRAVRRSGAQALGRFGRSGGRAVRRSGSRAI